MHEDFIKFDKKKLQDAHMSVDFCIACQYDVGNERITNEKKNCRRQKINECNKNQ